jgi:Ca2+:H+ antiporter
VKRSKKQFVVEHALDALLVFIPVAVVLHYSHAPEIWTFIASGVAIIPLAGWMGKATESWQSDWAQA